MYCKTGFDLYTWNRFGIEETCNADNIYSYNALYSDDLTRIQKVKAYLGFRRFVLKILKNKRYERIIVLPTQTAVLFADVLIFNYKGRYVLDIRDYVAEENIFFSLVMRLLISHSGRISLTSPAFKSFLPKGKYLISHNFTPVSQELLFKYRNRNRDQDVPISDYVYRWNSVYLIL